MKKLYQKWVHEKIDYMQKHSEYYKPEQVKRIQHIEEQLSEL